MGSVDELRWSQKRKSRDSGSSSSKAKRAVALSQEAHPVPGASSAPSLHWGQIQSFLEKKNKGQKLVAIE